MTYWFDFTTTHRNRGRNGIAGVEWHLGRGLLALDPGVRAFWSHDRNGLVEIDPVAELGGAVYAGNAAPMTLDAGRAGAAWIPPVRAALGAVVGEHAPMAERALAVAYRSGASRLRRVSSGVQRRLPAERSARRLVDVVTADDVVVSVGADWSGVLADRLGELKSATGCRVVTMVYDLIPLSHTHLAFHQDPQLFESYFRRLVEVSDLITCISHQSNADLLDFVARQGLVAPPTAVLRLGDGAVAPIGPVGDRDDFLLVVGTVERRKNVELVYDALRILDHRGAPLPTVVVAGAAGWGVDDFLAEIELQSNPASRAMVMLGGVDDETLDRLYSRARALLFPSHYEGWGLPLREAAVRGCPVVAGDSPAAREALHGHEAATMLSPDDPEPWADHLEDMVSGPVGAAAFRPWSDAARSFDDIVETTFGRRTSATGWIAGMSDGAAPASGDQGTPTEPTVVTTAGSSGSSRWRRHHR